ncbi:MAG: ABC transporter permease subunit, partial [Rhizobiales bacterium]|nr:ABC transporter permease subunit [Hyphomicrobiales bacterium]
MASQDTLHRIDTGKVSPLYDPRIRGIFFQSLLFIFLVGFIYWIIGNTVDNLQRAHIASGFGFLQRRAGFDVSDALIAYSSDSTIERALFVGFLNTLLVSVFGIITASILGFLIGIGRLSTNWLIRKICMVYVEIFRNIPPLLVIFFWYIGVLSV